MKKLPLPLLAAVAVLVVSGCDFKETRSGRISLNGAANIPLNDRGGSRAELVAGPAKVTFKKGSADKTVAISIRQDGRPEVNLEAPVSGDYRTGNFTLRGSEIGQPVDLVSARNYAVTGSRESYTEWSQEGFQSCLYQVSYEPCDESWSVSFRSAAGELGAFAATTPTRCNERRSNTGMCRREHEPRPDFPRGPRGQHALLDGLESSAAEKVKFD